GGDAFVEDRGYGACAEAACEQAVAGGGCSAALDVSEDDHPRLHPEASGQRVGHRDHAAGARTLRDHDYRRALAAAMALLDSIGDVVAAEWDFGDDDRFCAAAERDRYCDEATVAAHHLNTEHSL